MEGQRAGFTADQQPKDHRYTPDPAGPPREEGMVKAVEAPASVQVPRRRAEP